MALVRPRLWPKRPTPTRVIHPVQLNNPLPNYEGPKLHPFHHRSAPIYFVDLLNAETPGEDGWVFEVVIELKRYALKVFKFYDHRRDMNSTKGTEFELSEQAFIAQFDPFYSECRAYGRMEERHQNSIVAVRAYGFMDIPADKEGLMSCFPFCANDWNRPDEEYSWPIVERQPFRAIVKDLVHNKANFSNVAQMRDDLLALQQMGVYVQDIEKANYCNGKLVDFSLCWTAPHVLVNTQVRPQDHIDEELIQVRWEFDRMLEADGIYTRAKALAGSGNWEPEEEDEEMQDGQPKSRMRSITVGRLRRKTKKPERLGF